MPCVYVLVFASVCVSVHMCTSLCDSKHIIFGGACWLCLILCACPNHQGSLCVSASIFPSHPPPPFSIYLSVPLFLLPIWNFCWQLLWTSVVPISYWILPGEPLLFTIANGSIHASENNSSSWRKFRLHTTQTQSVINENYNGCQYLTEENLP